MVLNIQIYLKNRDALGIDIEKTFQDLKEGLGIYTNRHSVYPNLVQFSYDQIESDKRNIMVHECRGLILDSTDNWKVVAFPFKRFANYGEDWAANIDWNHARVQEKVDGSLIIMYFYDNKWHVATRGSANADGQVGDWKKYGTDQPWVFRDLFWHSCEYWLKGLTTDGILNPNHTYMYELTTPYNRVVCDYTKTGVSQAINMQSKEIFEFEDDQTGYAHDGSRITLIGVRDNVTLEELPVSEFEAFHYVVKEFPLTSFEEVVKAAEELEPIKQEGFVVVDCFFNRVKIKSPKYVALHHLRDGFGTRRLVELIKMGEEGEFLTYFPEFSDQFSAYKKSYDNLVEIMAIDWNFVNTFLGPNASQKDFAILNIKSSKVPAYLFSKRKGMEEAENPIKFLKNMHTDKLIEVLESLNAN